MLIKKKLLSAGGLHVSDEKYALDKIDIRCYVLLGKVRDFRVVDHKLEPLEPEEVSEGCLLWMYVSIWLVCSFGSLSDGHAPPA